MKIKPADLVLEIGSGGNPRSRSDILCDRYVYDNAQRGGTPIVVDRPFVVGDAHNLPFKDKTFDYVICSHIIEHLKDPLRFVKEVMRVGKAGCIEAPSTLSERLFGWNFHLWFVALSKNTLILTKKKEGERFGGFFHRLIKENISFRRFFDENQNKFYTSYEWKGRIKLKVDRKEHSLIFFKNEEAESFSLLREIDRSFSRNFRYYLWTIGDRLKIKISRERRKFFWFLKQNFYKEKILDSLLPLLACSRCQSKVVLDKTRRSVICRHCKEKYSIKGIMPIMLTKEERKRGY